MNSKLSDNILILGGSGQLGTELRRLFPEAAYSTHNQKDQHCVSLEDTDKLSEYVGSVKPSIIINAAAMTNVDLCESEKTAAYIANGQAVREIVKIASKSQVKLVHVSTDYIFDGESGLYSESDLPNPINYYGFSKLVGDIFAQCYTESLIVRTSGVYGLKKNFPYFVYSSLKEKQTTKVIDSYYSPIHAFNLADSIKELLTLGITGIVNVAGIRISRYEFAHRIAERFGLDENRIEKDVNWLKGRARRPFDSSLDISKARSLLKSDFYSVDSNLTCFEKTLHYVDGHEQ